MEPTLRPCELPDGRDECTGRRVRVRRAVRDGQLAHSSFSLERSVSHGRQHLVACKAGADQGDAQAGTTKLLIMPTLGSSMALQLDL